jgi:hypothetical protein
MAAGEKSRKGSRKKGSRWGNKDKRLSVTKVGSGETSVFSGQKT